MTRRVDELLGESPPRLYVFHFIYPHGRDELRSLAEHFDGKYQFIRPQNQQADALPSPFDDDLPAMR